MSFIFITLGAFLLCMFLMNIREYLKSPKYNSWVNGKVNSIELNEEQEIWNIKWIAPSKLREKNSEDEQFFYFNFKHNKKFKSIEEKKNYINDKNFKNVGNDFFLSLYVDKQGIIRDVGKYSGYMTKIIGYGVSILIFSGLIMWNYL